MEGIIQSQKDLDLLLKSAKEGDIDAQCEMSFLYHYGYGILEKNEQLYWEWLEKVMFDEDATLMAEEYDQRQFQFILKYAESGVVEAQMQSWFEYERDSGPVGKNEQLALKWMKRAAESGNSVAQNSLGLHYVDENNAERNFQEAVKWFEKAALQGDMDGEFNMGLCYLTGQGVVADRNKSIEYFEKAAGQGYGNAQKYLDELMLQRDSVNHAKKTGGCYIATAVYGSYDCPEVWTLRRYRDYSLAMTKCGSIFIKVYYIISPILVKCFGDTTWFKKFFKNKLDNMVKKLKQKGIADTRYKDKQY